MGGGVVDFHEGILSRESGLVNGISRIIEIRRMAAKIDRKRYIDKSGYMESEKAILALAALAQSTRLDVFRLLTKHEPEGLAAGDIAKALAVPQNTMSSHLAILSRAGLVTAQRISRSIVYRADLKAFQAVVLFMLRDCCDGRPEICGPLIEDLTPCCPPKTRRKAHV
jgi:DNA-binding transcriptional ArsR family regulator